MKITIEGATHEELARSLAELLFTDRYNDEDGHGAEVTIERRARKLIDERVDKALLAGVTASVSEYTAAKAREVVDAIIVGGVQTTNEYGRPRDHKTWSEFILSQLTGTDGYDRRSKVDKIAADCVEILVRDHFKGMFAEITAKVRAQVDEAIGVRIKAAIRAGAGL